GKRFELEPSLHYATKQYKVKTSVGSTSAEVTEARSVAEFQFLSRLWMARWLHFGLGLYADYDISNISQTDADGETTVYTPKELNRSPFDFGAVASLGTFFRTGKSKGGFFVDFRYLYGLQNVSLIEGASLN